MKKYLAPLMEVSVFETEDVIMVSSATTEGVYSPTMGDDLIATGYEFISAATGDAPADVKAGAVFSWN